MISVVMLSWKRPKNVYRIIPKLVANDNIDDIVIWNNNPKQKLRWLPSSNKIRLVGATADCGMNAKFLCCLLAKNDTVLLQDDDLILPDEVIAELFDAWNNNPDPIHGIWGLNPNENMEYHFKYSGPKTDIVISRAIMFHRKYAIEAFSRMYVIDKEIASLIERVGGDVFLSYVVMSVSKQKNVAHSHLRDKVLNLPEPFAVWKRAGHVENRTTVLRECIRKFDLPTTSSLA